MRRVRALRRPSLLADRVRGRLERSRQPTERPAVPAFVETSAAVHRFLGVACGGGCLDPLSSVLDDVARRLGGAHHHDAGQTFLTAVWIAVRHTSPEVVVETGVAHGVTSAVILAALARNGSGRLWSVDLPPAGWPDREWGRAVDPAAREAWTLRRGASRKVLPAVLADVGAVDVFVHDSLHTYGNMTFEIEAAWAAMNPGGVLVCDDADDNMAFSAFAEGRHAVLLAEPDKSGAVGLAVKGPPSTCAR